jgi:hypothetical protein
MRQFIVAVCVTGVCACTCRQLSAEKVGQPAASAAQDQLVGKPYGDYIIGNPVSHENLTVFPISSKAARNNDRYLTLDEGLAAGTVKVLEVGAERARSGAEGAQVARNGPRQSLNQAAPRQEANQAPAQIASEDLFGGEEADADVNKLMVLNTSGKPLYLMPGEVISGGKQDRTIGQEMVIAPSTKPVPIDVFCVEHGRWSGRSLEGTTSQLAAANEINENLSLPGLRSIPVDQLAKEAQGGKFVASAGQLSKDARLAVQQSGAQGKVWGEVAKTNSKVGNRSGSGNFAANYSSHAIAKDFEPYVKKLKPTSETAQIVGVAVAVNGKMLSIDVFESTPLFKKFWPKLLKSYALDAVAAKAEKRARGKPNVVAVDDCVAFLKTMEKSKAETVKLAGGRMLDKRDSSLGTSSSYYDADAASASRDQKDAANGYGGGGLGGGVHTSVLAK